MKLLSTPVCLLGMDFATIFQSTLFHLIISSSGIRMASSQASTRVLRRMSGLSFTWDNTLILLTKDLICGDCASIQNTHALP